MSDRTVSITLTAKDNISKTFTQIGKSGAEMGNALEKAAQDAERGMEDFGDSARQSARSMDAIRASSLDLGLGLGVIAAGAALSGKAFRDQEISLNTLQRTYGDAAADLREFSNAIQDNTNYSNDAAIQAANIAGTLARNYGFTADEIQRVLQISVDLAATSGMGLAETTERVTAALRGEAEGAEILGLTMNQAAIDSQNLTLSMSNQEAGHFRLNALIEQSTFAQGAAAEQARGTYGAMTQLRDSVQDAAQSFGGFLGPLGEVGAFASDNAVKLAAMGIALGQLGKAAVAVKSVTTALLEARMAATGAQGALGVAALAGSAGIVGLGIAAAAAAAGGIYLLGNALKVDLPQASQSSIDAMQELVNTIVEAGDQSEYAMTLLTLDDVMTENKKVVDDYKDSVVDLGIIQQDFAEYFGGSWAEILERNESLEFDDSIFDDLTQAQKELIDTNNDLAISASEVDAAYATWGATAEAAAEVNAGLSAGMDELSEIWRESGEAGQFAQGEAMAYTEALIAGTITAADYEGYLQDLIAGYENAGEAALAATGPTEQYADLLRIVAANWNDISVEAARAQAAMTPGELNAFQIQQAEIDKAQNLSDLLTLTAQNYNVMSVEGARAAAAQAQQQRDINDVLEIAADNYNIMSVEAARAAAKQNAVNQQLADFEDRIPSVEAAMAGAQMSPIDLKVFLDDQEAREKAKKIATATEEMSRAFNAATAAATGTTDALESGFRTVVANTNAIASSSQGVADWATELINVQGEVGKIDDLLTRQIITQQDYNAAQAAFGPIAEANARIQDDVLEIQTKQAPVIAELAQAQADYMDTLANAPAEQQMFALAMMDSATSAEALQLATALLGENGDVFAPMVEAAANLHPYLATVLEQMGLIEQQPDGTWTVTADTEDAQSQIETLNDTVEKLAYTQILIAAEGDTEEAQRAFEELFGHAADWDETTTTAELDADAAPALAQYNIAANAVRDFDASSGTADLNVNDNASGSIRAAIDLLNSFDGRNAYSSITTEFITIGSAADRNLFATGGVIPQAALGRVMTGASIVGESGWELLLGGQGGMVVPHTASVQSVKGMGGGGGLTIEQLVINTTGDWDEITRQVTTRLVPAIERAVMHHERSFA